MTCAAPAVIFCAIGGRVCQPQTAAQPGIQPVGDRRIVADHKAVMDHRAAHALAQQEQRQVRMSGLDQARGDPEVVDHLRLAGPDAALRSQAEAALVIGVEDEAAPRHALARRCETLGIVIKSVQRQDHRLRRPVPRVPDPQRQVGAVRHVERDFMTVIFDDPRLVSTGGPISCNRSTRRRGARARLVFQGM